MGDYTWEDVMLGIDIRNEAEREHQRQKDISDKQIAEQNAMGWWSLGLSLVGGALFGPIGYAAGKNIGKWGADAYYDWETMEVDPGKFYASEAKEFKETRDKAATDQTHGQIFDAVTDLAVSYVQAGGLEEGFEGWSDLTTFGTGEDAWTVFGEGTWVDKWVPGAKTLPGDQSVFAGGGTKLWQKGGLKQLSENINRVDLKGAYATDQSINSLSDLGRLALSYQESEDEKAAS